jgi:pyruvate dehydrogenase E2 component (dihydrolipoamide acetyltransferase)
MSIEVVLPKVDMDMESGVIAAWRVAEGDFVRRGEVLFEMETNKALMEVESPGTGTIRGLAGITGEAVAVGTPVAWIDAAAREAVAIDHGNELRATPLARRTAKIRDVNLAQVTGSGPLGRIVATDV